MDRESDDESPLSHENPWHFGRFGPMILQHQRANHFAGPG